MGQNGETNPCHFLKAIKWHIQSQHILTSLRATWVKRWSFDSLYPFSSMTSKQTLTTLNGWCLNTGQTIWMLSWWLWVYGYDSTRASNHFSLKTKSPHFPVKGIKQCSTTPAVLQYWFLHYDSIQLNCLQSYNYPSSSHTEDKPFIVSRKPQIHQLLGTDQLSPTSCTTKNGLHIQVPAVKNISNPVVFYMRNVRTGKIASQQHSCFCQHILQRIKQPHREL